MQSHLYLQDLEKAADEGRTDFTLLIEVACENIFENLCKSVNVENNQDITAAKLKSTKSLTKEQLCGYLSTMCRFVVKFATPQMRVDFGELEDMSDLKTLIESLKDDKIEDQKTIIELQSTIIENQEGQL